MSDFVHDLGDVGVDVFDQMKAQANENLREADAFAVFTHKPGATTGIGIVMTPPGTEADLRSLLLRAAKAIREQELGR